MQFASTPGNQGKGKGVVPGMYALLGGTQMEDSGYHPPSLSMTVAVFICMCGRGTGRYLGSEQAPWN